jgi:hypothetical protein
VPVVQTAPDPALHSIPGVAVVSEAAAARRVTRGRGEPRRSQVISPQESSVANPAADPRTSASTSGLRLESLLAPQTEIKTALAPPSSVTRNDLTETLATELEDTEPHPPSRLAGLRKLLISLGRRSLNNDAEHITRGSDHDPRFDRATVRPAYAHPVAEGLPDESTPALLNALPEFLPPKPGAEPEKEKGPVRPTQAAPRRDGPEATEEIQTLPSWRGQYRKKRYPPI